MSREPLSPAPASPGAASASQPEAGQASQPEAGQASQPEAGQAGASEARAGEARAGRHVVVVGGGLAGITAAIALRETGARVTLLESRPRLGGATCSFTRGGLVVDNGQHVFLGCCTAYRELIARLGMTGSVSLQDRFDVAVLGPHGRARLRRTRLPGPLHMGQALVTYPLLSPAERLRVTRAALAMRFLDPARPGLDAQRLGDWLAAHGQSERARRVLWDLFTVSALNVAGDDANLSLAATVVRTALLGARDAADIGTPAVPLGDLHGQAAARLLGQLGASVRLGAKVTSVQPLDGGGFRVQLADRGVSAAPRSTSQPGPDLASRDLAGADLASPDLAAVDGVVLAVPPDAAARLLPAGAAAPGPGPERWRELGASPIVNVHVLYDRQVTSLPFAAAVDSPVQWVFDRTGPSGLDAGQYLAVSVSAADDVVDTPAAQLRERFVPALEEIFPAARDARITDFFVTRERRATFRQEPGCGGKRPGATTRLPGLVLAGAWTNTGWPDTMEGAVRSGLSAARELRREMTQSRHGVPVATRAAEVAGAPS
jgi:squalene-associated FAD-dependent desaturase